MEKIGQIYTRKRSHRQLMKTKLKQHFEICQEQRFPAIEDNSVLNNVKHTQ